MPGHEDAAIDHAYFLRRCLELAAQARELENTPVRSVDVLDGAIFGEGSEPCFMRDDAIRQLRIGLVV